MAEDRIQKIMMASDPADVAQLAMIEVMRQIADNGRATHRVLEGMQGELRDVRERVIRIEAVEVQGEIRDIRSDLTSAKDRIDRLESQEDQRKGAVGFADALTRYGPLVIAFVAALFVLLVATKRIVL